MTPRRRAVTALLITLGLVFCITSFAQTVETFVRMKDLPEAVRKTVQQQSEGAKLRGLIKKIESDQTLYQAELKVDGHKRYLLIDESGTVVEIDEEVPFASLPAEVRATIEQKAGKEKVKTVESITKNNVIVAYEAEVSSAGRIREIRVGADGKLISIVITDIVIR
ncbi:MAG TPA: hypothetical protein VLM38_22400 [Blastocatellia bacterium]|nr:hypothetical protein [Blastocatellia bacterium]